jgi:hypothetical protein
MLIAFGSEKSVSTCGVETFDVASTNVRYSNDVHPPDVVFDRINERVMKERGDWKEIKLLEVADQVKAAVALIVAAQAGHTASLVPLSTLLSTGVGLVPLLNDLQTVGYTGKKSRHILAHIFQYVPLPIKLAVSVTTMQDCNVELSMENNPVQCLQGIVVDSVGNLFYPLPLVFRLSAVIRHSAGLISKRAVDPNSNIVMKHKDSSAGKSYDSKSSKSVDGYDMPIGDSVFSWNTQFTKTNRDDMSHLNLVSKLSSGLLLLAALDDHPDAIIALQKRYLSIFMSITKDFSLFQPFGDVFL